LVKRKKGKTERDDLVSLLFLALLFFVLLVGREFGSIYSGYGEISRLSVLFQMDEDELADYMEGVLGGEEPVLDVGIALTLPSVRNVEGIVTEMPDYTRKWMIGVAVSPIIVRQPEISDVEIRLLVEGEEVHFQRFLCEKEKVPYISLLERSFSLNIEDVEVFREAVREASDLHGGEVEVTFTGRALLHVLFLQDWLPFSTTRYPLVRIPHVELESSWWVDSEGRTKIQTQTGQTIFIQFRIANPTRVHSISKNVTVTVNKQGSEEPIYTSWKFAPVAPGTTATYIFQFTPEEPGVYRYSLEAEDGLRLDKTDSPSLQVDDV
jgi:hypothetical protein